VKQQHLNFNKTVRTLPSLSLKSEQDERTLKSSAVHMLLERMLKQEQGIRFAALYEGERLIEGGMREGVHSYDPEAVSKEIDIEIAILGNVAKRWESWFGRLRYVALRFEKLNMIFVPITPKTRFLVISTEPSVDPGRIIDMIKQTVEG